MNILLVTLLAVVIGLQLVLIAICLRARAERPILKAIERTRAELVNGTEHEFRRLREEYLQQASLSREESGNHFTRLHTQLSQTLVQQFAAHDQQQQALLEAFAAQLKTLTEVNERRLERIRDVVEERLAKLQEDNHRKLEQMRQTVDEKLNESLERRLSASFRQVSERLEAVHKGLGEMQALAAHVGDLKRVLSNVKARGTLGEVQLEMLLEQILSPEQYEKNVATKKGSSDRVEFAIKLPGREAGRAFIYLPIDCKFPLEDYQRMQDAQEAGDTASFREASKALVRRIQAEAKSIAAKYLDPPNTTDFAILYLPVEGLFAEALRVPGLMERVQQEHRVVISGPTTLTAVLNSLQMGFRTLAIQRRSSEVWELLAAIKTQFGVFGDLLAKTRKKLQEASHSIDAATQRSHTIVRKLREVEELPVSRANDLLPEVTAANEAAAAAEIVGGDEPFGDHFEQRP
ncbi:MAG: DNA recombination protein RmuC [Alicyclobacillus sp.]|nr:DNA recombination protein RmuC [Alicyclobacillus sp.]